MDKALSDLTGKALSDFEHEMDGLLSGRMTPEDWRTTIGTDLYVYHLAAYLAGAASADVTPAVKTAVADLVNRQFDYLDQFYATIDAAGPDAMQEAWRARLALYAGALKATYSRGAFQDWPLPFHPTEDSECMVNCRCTWRLDVLDDEAGNADAYWETDRREVCPTCVDRAGGNPYMIRDGALQ